MYYLKHARKRIWDVTQGYKLHFYQTCVFIKRHFHIVMGQREPICVISIIKSQILLS